MNDTIYRDRAIDTAKIMRKRCDTDNIDDYHDLIIAALETLPPAKPTGKWICIPTKGMDYAVQCPFCSRKFFKKHGDLNEPLSYNYCPFCGSEMERN